MPSDYLAPGQEAATHRHLPPILCVLGLIGRSDAGARPIAEQAPISLRAGDGGPTRALLGRSAVDSLPEAIARVDSQRAEIVFELPPVDVPGARGLHAGMLRLSLHRADMPVSGSIHAFRVEIRDGTGRLLPADRLHHIILFDPDHLEVFAPIVHRVLAAGKETGAVSVPRLLLGMPLAQGQRLIVAAMISNPDPGVLRGARMRIVLDYVPWHRPWPLWQAFPWFIDVTFPLGGKDGGKAFDLPPGRSERSWEGSPAIAGTIVALGGHVHDYAVRLEFRDVTSGQLVWGITPVRDSIGRVLALPQGRLYRWYRLGVRVFPQHRYRVTVVYDNPTGAVLTKAAMGEVAGLIVPGERQTLARADSAAQLYRRDLDNILRNMSGEGEMHQHTAVEMSGMR